MTKEDARHHAEAWFHARHFLEEKGAAAMVEGLCLAVGKGYQELANIIEMNEIKNKDKS